MLFKKGHIPWNKVKRAEKRCLFCSFIFKIYPHLIEKRKYCSRKCYLKSRVGHLTSNRTRQKIRLSLLGKKHSEQRKKNISNGRKNIGWSEEQRKKFIKNHSGNKHYNWKGGRSKDISNGYILIYQPNKRPKREHRIIAEKMLKRKLKKAEVVHHINGIPDDNRLENLMIFKNNYEHLKFHRLQNVQNKG